MLASPRSSSQSTLSSSTVRTYPPTSPAPHLPLSELAPPAPQLLPAPHDGPAARSGSAAPHVGVLRSGVSALGLPVTIAFAVSYVLAATFLSVIDLAVAAGVQAWCLDYKQNCIDQHLASAQTLMAVELAQDSAQVRQTLLTLLPLCSPCIEAAQAHHAVITHRGCSACTNSCRTSGSGSKRSRACTEGLWHMSSKWQRRPRCLVCPRKSRSN